jgi:hypothetical protein
MEKERWRDNEIIRQTKARSRRVRRKSKAENKTKQNRKELPRTKRNRHQMYLLRAFNFGTGRSHLVEIPKVGGGTPVETKATARAPVPMRDE